ncbi:MAG TPA: ATP-binding cassette domain-containing protein [Saprospiraceae bacterium]|nr:ATP-binding cassette domain-containing protein [Saprospiraceae bacterium]
MNGNITFNTLFRKLFQFRQGIIYAIFLYLIWSIIEISIPFFTQIIIDEGIRFSDRELIAILVIAIAVFNIAGMGADFSKTWIMRNIGVRLNITVIEHYFKKLISKDYLYFNKVKEGKVLQDVNDNLRIENFLTISLITFLNTVVKISIFSFILFYFYTTVAIIFILWFVLLVIWDVSLLGLRAKVDQERFQMSSRIQSEIIQSVQGITDIKVNHLEQKRMFFWGELQQFISNIRLNILRLVHWYKGGTLVLTQIRDAAVLLISCFAIVKGEMTLGTLIAIQYILNQSNTPANDFLQVIQDRQDAKLSLERLREVLTGEFKDLDTHVKPLKGDLIIEGVSFKYPESEKGIFDVNLKIPFGKKIAIIGESGNGKTTLLKLLLGLLEPGHGKIFIKTGQINYPVHLCSFGVLPQEGFVFDGTLAYNISLAEPTDTDYDRVKKVAQIACLDEIAEDLPEKYETQVGKNGKRLSKGQSQRVLLARAMYVNSHFLILDEPTSSLDNKTSRRIFENIVQAFPDKTLIVVTHQIYLAAKMDEVWVIDNGKVLKTIDQSKGSAKEKSKYLSEFYENT